MVTMVTMPLPAVPPDEQVVLDLGQGQATALVLGIVWAWQPSENYL